MRETESESETEETQRERQRENIELQSKHGLSVQKRLIEIFARKGFVKVCPVGWIAKTGLFRSQ